MREHHVGSIVIADERNGKRMPAGIVTDRDIVVAVLHSGLSDAIQVGDLMNRELVVVRENTVWPKPSN